VEVLLAGAVLTVTALTLLTMFTASKPPEGFTAVLEAEPVAEDLTAVTVRVSWREGLRGREMTLSTLFSRRGALAAWTREGGEERPTYPAEGGP
jgi:hypothetical protein